MSKIVRTFTIAELREQDFPWNSDFAEEITEIHHDSDRWMENYSLIVKMADDGFHYSVDRTRGLTEYQETSYEDTFYDDPVEFVRVEQVPVTVLQWKTVEDTSTVGE